MSVRDAAQELRQDIFHDFHVDWVTYVMVGKFALVMSLALGFAQRIPRTPGNPIAANPYDWRAVLFIMAGILIGGLTIGGLYIVYKRLRDWILEVVPEWLKKWVTAKISVWWVPVAVYFNWRAFVIGTQPLMLVFTIVITIMWWYDMLWIPFNLFVLLVASVAGAIIGNMLAPLIIISVLAGVAILDHAEVNLTGIMDRAAAASIEWGLPNFVVIPNQWTINLKEVKDIMADEDRGEVAQIIGAGDFALPAALPASINVFTGSTAFFAGFSLPTLGAAAGVLVAVVIIRSRVYNRKDTTPGIPYLGGGAIIGFLIGAALSGDPIPVALGLQQSGCGIVNPVTEKLVCGIPI